MKRLARAILIASSFFAVPAPMANAATVTYACPGGPCYPTAVLGLSVGEQTYDVAFMQGSYGDLFPGGALFPNSSDIATALMSVLTDAHARDIYYGSSYATEFSIPFAILGLDLGITVGTNPFGNWILKPIQLGSMSQGRFAVPALVAPVPLPATLPLFAATLSAMGFFGWRKKLKVAVAG